MNSHEEAPSKRLVSFLVRIIMIWDAHQSNDKEYFFTTSILRVWYWRCKHWWWYQNWFAPFTRSKMSDSSLLKEARSWPKSKCSSSPFKSMPTMKCRPLPGPVNFSSVSERHLVSGFEWSEGYKSGWWKKELTIHDWAISSTATKDLTKYSSHTYWKAYAT